MKDAKKNQKETKVPDYFMNRLANCHNRYQGSHKRVLCVCSAGLLRSPTAAVVLSQPPFNFNTRAAGASQEYALVPLDRVLIEWADEIVCMDDEQAYEVRKIMRDVPEVEEKEITILRIADSFRYRDPDLMRQIAEKYSAFHPEIGEDTGNDVG